MLERIVKHYPEIRGIHPACTAVPAISDEEMQLLCSSVASNGLRNDITLTIDGLLVDGRNRLIACHRAKVEPRFKRTAVDPWQVAFDENIARRHLTTGQRAMFAAARLDHERAEAKKRHKETAGRPPKNGGNVATIKKASAKGKSRDKAAEAVGGVGARSVEKAAAIKELAPDVAEQVASGAIALEQGYREARKRQRESEKRPRGESPQADRGKATATVLAVDGAVAAVPMPARPTFNRTNNSVDWASWTWNPVTGCEHGCNFCYARELAHSSRLAPYYPHGFKPALHSYRMQAPSNTAKPDSGDPRDGRVFVCSMADLFGKWVPDAWIEMVFEACLAAPQWEYLFLTKWPARYSTMPLIPRAWYGASVVRQSDAKRVSAAMQKIRGDAVRWVSMEPMLEPIDVSGFDWCDLLVIGAQTLTTQPDGVVPAFSPCFEWVADVVTQCRDMGVPYYLKDNLGADPGMAMPKMQPRRA